MKNIYSAILIVSVVAFVGCSAIDKTLLTATPTITPAVTNQVVHVVADTNGVIIATNVEQVIIPSFTNTTYAPAPVATATAGIVGALPFPGAGVVGIALGWLLTAYAAIRNRKLAVALVTGIDAGRTILQTTPEGQKLDAKFKDALIQHQEVSGVLQAASKLVNAYTGDTVKPAN